MRMNTTICKQRYIAPKTEGFLIDFEDICNGPSTGEKFNSSTPFAGSWLEED